MEEVDLGMEEVVVEVEVEEEEVVEEFILVVDHKMKPPNIVTFVTKKVTQNHIYGKKIPSSKC